MRREFLFITSHVLGLGLLGTQAAPAHSDTCGLGTMGVNRKVLFILLPLVNKENLSCTFLSRLVLMSLCPKRTRSLIGLVRIKVGSSSVSHSVMADSLRPHRL